ncbi:MAG: RluA family pseudouridine synthase [Anaerolineae bacterium]|nr:RluA family pseudouridine synthase [Anaerolineae bacterium]
MPFEEERVFTVPVEAAGMRLDKFLADHLADVSRSRIQGWIEEGRVTLDGRPTRPSTRLDPGQHIRVLIPPPEEVRILPEPIPLDILYEDDHLLVINKPAGMVVHPAPGHTSGTLVNALLARFPAWAELDWWESEEEDEEEAGVDYPRPGIVHRLDKDTSGLLIVAKSASARGALQAQFQARQVEKVYLALVHGMPSAPAGLIDAPIGRDPRQRKRMAVVAEGRPAVTAYRVLEPLGEYALLEVMPKTGRTHQIRVHLAFIGHPVVGDEVYGRRRSRLACPRQFLHAARLSFRHPVTGRPMEFSAPLPPDLQAVLEEARERIR